MLLFYRWMNTEFREILSILFLISNLCFRTLISNLSPVFNNSVSGSLTVCLLFCVSFFDMQRNRYKIFPQLHSKNICQSVAEFRFPRISGNFQKSKSFTLRCVWHTFMYGKNCSIRWSSACYERRVLQYSNTQW